MDPVVPSTERQGAITVTPAEIIAHRRRQLLELADRLGNVSEACRQMGISRTRYYQWRRLADRYGLEALTPKGRRRPQLPNATPTHVVERLLSLAVTRPTLGARRYADELGADGFAISKTTVAKILAEHQLSRRGQRLARAAAIAAATSGLVTDACRDEPGPSGFCHWAPGPGVLVAMDSFYIGNLKGVGPVYQLTAVDTFTRWASVAIIAGHPTAAVTARFLGQVIAAWRRHGYSVQAVVTDNGAEYTGKHFTGALAAGGLRHVRIPPRSPNHNAVVERFHGTALQECWRPAFHRRRFSSVPCRPARVATEPRACRYRFRALRD
jgi:transposase InsO family protein